VFTSTIDDALVSTPSPTTTPAPTGGHSASGLTVLLVEDSVTQRRIAQHLLQKCGSWKVLVASDGVAALEVMEHTLPNLVLTDMHMPRLGGMGLLEKVRELYPDLPVVLMTAEENERLAVDALRAGATDYVRKNELGENLAEILDRVYEKTQAAAARRRIESGVTGHVTRYSLENDSSLVSPLIAKLREELVLRKLCDLSSAMRVGIALEEALLNAIYHGNLEVSSDLRHDGDEPFHRLANTRRRLSPYSDRRVFVSARLSHEKATFVIADQGPGFDVSQLADPTDPANLERPSGRGFLLMKMFMDEVRHNPTGNQLTLVKYRQPVSKGM
jgi:CheY-like chemotaxis protein/anti-sigma regulatory factor (Ser/Thr protein kinase)